MYCFAAHMRLLCALAMLAKKWISWNIRKIFEIVCYFMYRGVVFKLLDIWFQKNWIKRISLTAVKFKSISEWNVLNVNTHMQFPKQIFYQHKKQMKQLSLSVIKTRKERSCNTQKWKSCDLRSRLARPCWLCKSSIFSKVKGHIAVKA